MNFRTVLFIIGCLLSGLAATMLLPIVCDMLSFQPDNAIVFLKSMSITGFFGVAMMLANKPKDKIQLGTREAFVTTSLTWVFTCFFAAFPFYHAASNITFVDAYFEAVSALTTTGATVLNNLNKLPRGILLWRSILQWLGGVGIVVMAMTIFPALRIGGMQLFRSEFSDKSEKILPRVSQIASAILVTYITFTFVSFLALFFAGMTFFDAVCHAMTAISTGGLSTKDTSIAAFDSPLIEFILMVCMFIGGSALILYVRLWNHDWKVLKDSQLKAYTFLTIISVLVLTSWHWVTQNGSLLESLRKCSFTVISFITTTGYVTNDYTLWGPFAITILFMLSFCGGCTGSTTGGIKIFRFQVISKLIKTHLLQLRRPHGVFVAIYQGIRITDSVVFSIFTFIGLYIVSTVLVTLLLALIGLDFQSAVSGAVACLSNVGPGVSQLVNYSGNMSDLPSLAKIIMMLSMIVGRLEFLTVIVLLMPSFWKE